MYNNTKKCVLSINLYICYDRRNWKKVNRRAILRRSRSVSRSVSCSVYYSCSWRFNLSFSRPFSHSRFDHPNYFAADIFTGMFIFESMAVRKKAFEANHKEYCLLIENKVIPLYVKNQPGRASLSIMLNISGGSAKFWRSG